MKQPYPCQTADPEMWFPVSERSTNTVLAAKAGCAVCPIRQACLDDAMERRTEFGIWGGTTPGERMALRRAGLVTVRRTNAGDRDRTELVRQMASDN